MGLCATSAAETPEWVSLPGDQWESITPEEAGLDETKFNAWVASQKPKFGVAYGGQQPERGGAVITRGGYILHTWGDPGFKFQSASLGKTFTRIALQLAIDEGLIENSADLVRDYWTGERLLTPHKVMTRGHNAEVSFDHLQNMKAGFPVTNGYLWRTRDATGIMGPKTIPHWANYNGDPDYDNYAHVVPGTTSRYSSGGYWRLSQALTAIWKKDLKQVLDERIMSKIGIPASRWDWLTGEAVRKNRDFYPDMPGYGDYLDAPYRIDEIPVRGGPGWVVMSAQDLARLGLLVATGGVWEGERLISKIGGNTGVGANTMNGWNVVHNKAGYFSFGKVATRFRDPAPDEMASWIVGPVKMNRQ
jgi:CubicO group peptidase (beta-lactamase class C family)